MPSDISFEKITLRQVISVTITEGSLTYTVKYEVETSCFVAVTFDMNQK
jgi:hypothetical protein